MFDRSGTVVFANYALTELLRAGEEAVVGRTLSELVPAAVAETILASPATGSPATGTPTSPTSPASPATGSATIVASPATGAPTGAEPSRVACRLRRFDGTGVDTELSLGATTGLSDLRAVTIRRADHPGDDRDYLALAVRIGDHLHAMTDPDLAAGAVLELLCDNLGWDAACMWRVAPDRANLQCVATWPDDGGPTQPFETVSKTLNPRLGEGLPGSAWSSRRALVTSTWSGNLARLRQEQFELSGLQTGLAFPVVADTAVIGVVEMFSRRLDPIAPRLLDSLASVGQQIGQRLRQMDTESHLRESERLNAFLMEAAAVLAGSADYGDSLRRLAALSVPAVADLCIIDIIEADGRIERMAAAHADPDKADLVAELAGSFTPANMVDHPTLEVIATGRSICQEEVTPEELRAAVYDKRHLKLLTDIGFDSLMCVPLQVGDVVLGAMSLVSAGSGRRFSVDDLAVPEELARRAARIVAVARSHDHEQRVAQDLQRLLLPEQLPEFDHLEVCVRYIASAPGAAAGGDFYDVVVLPSHRIGMAIGDVEGHDTLAAATMGQLRSASRALAGQVPEPEQLVDALRWSWPLLGFERTATALFARVDQLTGRVDLASAGHFPPALVDESGRARFIEMPISPLLGAPGDRCVGQTFWLGPGEMLFFFTDGLIEERTTGIDESLLHLLEVLERSSAPLLDDVCAMAIADLERVDGGADDVAVMAVRRRRHAPPAEG